MKCDERNIFVVDDDKAVLTSLKSLLIAHQFNTRLFTSANEFLAHYQPEMGGCLLLDIKMPTMSGLELQEELISLGSKMPIVFVSGAADIPSAVKALKKGAFEFLEKPYKQAQLIEVINRALAFADSTRQKDADLTEIILKLDSLTKRETEVLNLLVEGNANKSIANQLGLSPRTVEIHRARLMQKLQAKSLATLIKMVQKTSIAD